MREKNRMPPLLVLLCFLLLSCSVKEDRGECPVYININFDEVIRKDLFRKSLVCHQSASVFGCDNLELLEYEGTGYDVTASRGVVRLSAAFGHQACSFRSDTLLVQEGAEIGKLFVWSDMALCEDDLYCVSARPHKQYCTMNVIVCGELPWQDADFDLRLKANCNSLSLFDMEPLEGNYTALLERKNASGYEIRIPRQKTSDVIIELLEKNVRGIYSEEDLIGVVNVGQELSAGGYDWNKEDLDDVYVTVDFARCSASIEIVPWNPETIDVQI